MSQFIQDTNSWMTGNTPVTLQPTGKYPVVANLQWKTLADLKEFVCDPESTAIVGMVVAVVEDEYYDNNGVYVIDEIGEDGKVSKLGEHIYTAGNEQDGDNEIKDFFKTVEIGDVPSGLTKDDELIYNQPIHRILDMLLYKTLQPEVTEPSVEFDYNDETVIMVPQGTNLPDESDFNFSYDRGLVTYPYNEDLVDADPSEYYYTGEVETEWVFTGPEQENPREYNFNLPMDYEGIYTITYKVTFNEGEDLWDNKRNPATVEKYTGGVIEKTVEFHAVKPMYVNDGLVIDELNAKLEDYYESEDGTVTFDVNIVKETEDNKFELHIPQYSELLSVYQYNTLSDTYNIPIEMVEKGDDPDAPHLHDSFGEYDAYVRTHNPKDIQGASSYRITIRR